MEPVSTEIQSIRQRLIERYQIQASGILHLGAHFGQERERYAQLGKSVLWVEAHPEIFARLQRNLIKYPKQRALCALLAEIDGQLATFYRSNNADGVSSSLFNFGTYAVGERSLWPELDLRMIGKISLPTLRLDTLMIGNAIKAEDYSFWVVDLQGAEDRALAGADQSIVSCKALLVEVSTVEVYQGGARWEALREQLGTLGFVPLWEPIRPHDDVLFVHRSATRTPRKAFQSDHYLRHNQRRLEHLACLGLKLNDKTVLEVGAGIGDHSSFYLDRGCRVLATDGRRENIEILRTRYCDSDCLEAAWLDLNNPEPLERSFEIVHCYGLLYHLERPAAALAYLADHCAELLLLESCVSFGDEEELNPIDEEAVDPTQALGGLGCRPTRAWIWRRLRQHFSHVYATRTQPNHEEFPLEWSQAHNYPRQSLTRAVFIASRSALSSPSLLPELPYRYERF